MKTNNKNHHDPITRALERGISALSEANQREVIRLLGLGLRDSADRDTGLDYEDRTATTSDRLAATNFLIALADRLPK